MKYVGAEIVKWEVVYHIYKGILYLRDITHILRFFLFSLEAVLSHWQCSLIHLASAFAMLIKYPELQRIWKWFSQTH